MPAHPREARDHLFAKGGDHLLGDAHLGRREQAFEALHISLERGLASPVVCHPLDKHRFVGPRGAALGCDEQIGDGLGDGGHRVCGPF